VTIVITKRPGPSAELPPAPVPTGPCWADPLTRAERRELRWMLAHAANAFFGAQPPQMACCTEMQDLHLDVTERAAVATS
jgi:hypothetical protein